MLLEFIILISIHAPASGATVVITVVFDCFNHFNPRSREWSDTGFARSGPVRRYFNPRSREWSDQKRIFAIEREEISIHAPASGATFTSTAPSHAPTIFQSTLPRVERPPLVVYTRPAFAFQSTLPRVERLTFIISAHLSSDFNPRSREWSDRIKGDAPRFCTISIHAPASGATSASGRFCPHDCYFNPRSREWSDGQWPGDTDILLGISIHAPASGATDNIFIKNRNR